MCTRVVGAVGAPDIWVVTGVPAIPCSPSECVRWLPGPGPGGRTCPGWSGGVRWMSVGVVHLLSDVASRWSVCAGCSGSDFRETQVLEGAAAESSVRRAGSMRAGTGDGGHRVQRSVPTRRYAGHARGRRRRDPGVHAWVPVPRKAGRMRRGGSARAVRCVVIRVLVADGSAPEGRAHARGGCVVIRMLLVAEMVMR